MSTSDSQGDNKAKEFLSCLDKEYSPSAWSKRFATRQEVINYHLEFARRLTNENRGKYNCVNDVPYDDSADQSKMDIYFKTEDTDNSIFVYLHGGNWQELTRNEAGYCVAPVVEQSARAIVFDYELCPKVSLEKLVQNVKRGIKYIFKYAEKTKAKSIVLCGHSAGAHLIASILDTDFFEIKNVKILKSVVLISGLFDLRPLRNSYVNDNNKLGLELRNIRKLSPVTRNYEHLQGFRINFEIFVAENESSSSIKQSLDFANHLHEFGLRVKFTEIEQCDHFDIVERLNDPEFEITEIILKHL